MRKATNQPPHVTVLRVFQTRDRTRAFYNKISHVYDLLSARSEAPVRRAGLELLTPRTRQKVLAIGFGTGHSLVRLAQAAGRNVALWRGWLGAARVFPLGHRWPSGDYVEVQASVSRFEVTQVNQAVLVVHWRIVVAKTGAVLQARQTKITRDAANVTQDPDRAVRALSEAVAAWSREVAEAVTALASSTVPGP